MEKIKMFNDFVDLAQYLYCVEKSRREHLDLPRSVHRFLIPLSIVKAGSTFSALLVTTQSLISKQELKRQVAWEACFRGIQTFEWFVLFELINSDIKSETLRHQNPWYLGILYESSPRGGTWYSNHPALRKSREIAKKRVYDRKEQSLLDVISSNLQLTKPTIFTQLKLEEIEVRKPKPRELRFVGIGYKDQGSLGDSAALRLGDVPLCAYDSLLLSFDDSEKSFTNHLQTYLNFKKEFLK